MRRLLFVTALMLGANVAQADNGLFYFGAGITDNNVNDIVVQGVHFPRMNSTSWKVFAGFRLIRLFAVEADYLDLGSQTKTDYHVNSGSSVTWDSDQKVFAGYAVGFLPIPLPNLDVYGKAGLALYKLNASIATNSSGAPYFLARSDNSTVLTWGAGVQAHIGIVGGRLEYEGFDKASTSVFSLSLFLNLK